MSLQIIIGIVIVWLVGIVCICIMKKIQPNDKSYSVWAIFVCMILMGFLLYYEFY